MLDINDERIYRNLSLKDTSCIIMHYFLIAEFVAVSVVTDFMWADTNRVDGGPAAASDSHAIYTLYLSTCVVLYRAYYHGSGLVLSHLVTALNVCVCVYIVDNLIQHHYKAVTWS
jgi:hypothetical protein